LGASATAVPGTSGNGGDGGNGGNSGPQGNPGLGGSAGSQGGNPTAFAAVGVVVNPDGTFQQPVYWQPNAPHG